MCSPDVFMTCLLFCKSGLCVHDVLWVDGGVAFHIFSFHPFNYWATGYSLFSNYLFIILQRFIFVLFFILLLYLTLPQTHSLQCSIILKKMGNLRILSLFYSPSIFLTPYLLHFHTRHSALSHPLMCIQHLSLCWVLPLCRSPPPIWIHPTSPLWTTEKIENLSLL